MMRFFDFSSWHSILTTLLGLALFTLIGMGVRVLMMFTIQQRQQRMNRQINERLRTLMAAYKVLGGSFTGRLTVDPRSPRAYMAGSRKQAEQQAAPSSPVSADTGTVVEGSTVTSEHVTLASTQPGVIAGTVATGVAGDAMPAFVIERRVQIRDTVEAALSDILLLGTEEQVRLAARAASELAAGHPIHTAELVVSLRNYIRKALALEAIDPDVIIPAQGPTRPASNTQGGPGGRNGRGDRQASGEREGGPGGSGPGAGSGAGGMGGGGGLSMGMGFGMGRRSGDDA